MTVRQIGEGRPAGERPGDVSTVADVLRRAARTHGGVEAYVEPALGGTGRRAVTFAELDRAADGVAGLLAAAGAAPGTVVCLLLPSSIEYAAAYAGAVRSGAVTSGVNLRMGPAGTEDIIARTRPAVTVVDDGLDPPPVAGTVVSRTELADVVEAAVAGAAGNPPPPAVALAPDDPVCVVWTSGTTGRPKGAVFDHRNLAAAAAGTDVLSAPGDRRLSPLPFAHVGSMTRVWDEAAHAVTTVITPTPWRAADALAVIEAERITVAQGVPTQWALMLDHPSLATTDTSSLRIVSTGAARVAPELVAALRATFGVPVVVRYTSTEASLGTGTVPGDGDGVVARTVGRPVPGVELSVVDDDGTPVADGEVGRVRLRSGAVMRGYWGGPPTGAGAAGLVLDAGATAEVLADDGWLTTGDYGALDGGNLRLVGRANELYIRGGYNVYPAEVEAVLGGHPALSGVAVIGVPDPVLGEIGAAAVVPGPGCDLAPDELLAELRTLARASLADYKAPDRLVVLDALPLTTMLKVDKRALAARLPEMTAVVAVDERSTP